MAYAKWKMLLSPSSGNSMQITGANPTRLNLDINIVVAKRLGLELIEVELRPLLRVFDLEAFERIWINHFDLSIPKKQLN